MNKKIVIFALLILTGCAARSDINPEKSLENTVKLSEEKITASPFILTAAQGYVNTDNYTIPHTYVIDTYQNEVYVDTHEEPSGLTPEEIIENAEKQEVVESIH